MPVGATAEASETPAVTAHLVIEDARCDLVVPGCPLCGCEHTYLDRGDVDSLPELYPARCPTLGYGFFANLRSAPRDHDG